METIKMSNDEIFDDEPSSYDMNEMISITKENFPMVVNSLHAKFPEIDRIFFEELCLSILNQEMLFADFMEKVEQQVANELEKNLKILVDSGDAEMGVNEKTGEVTYWLTPQGEEKAERVERLLKKEIEDFFGESETPEEE
jgi:hypothetical protein